MDNKNPDYKDTNFDAEGRLIREKWIVEQKLDMICLGFPKEGWDVAEKDKSLHIRMRTLGHSFSYEWLTYIGESTRTGKNGQCRGYRQGQNQRNWICLILFI